MGAPRRRATYEDLVNVPDTMVAEIVGGELFATPRPRLPHTLAASAIAAQLFGAFGDDTASPGAPGGWWILFEPELHLGEDVVVPDVAGWRRQRLPLLPDAAFLDLAPDWACEVVSPSTGALDRGRKMGVYAREGVHHLWIVDPTLRTLEVYRLETGRWIVASTHAGADPVRAEPFVAIDLAPGRWWRT